VRENQNAGVDDSARLIVSNATVQDGGAGLSAQVTTAGMAITLAGAFFYVRSPAARVALPAARLLAAQGEAGTERLSAFDACWEAVQPQLKDQG